MLTYLRYTLAAVCFAASVGCLPLWWRSFTIHEQIFCQRPASSEVIYVSAFRGAGYLGVANAPKVPITWQHVPIVIADMNIPAEARFGPPQFGWMGKGYYFPLWYAALIFALAGVGVLRFRRQFSIRSALIATTAIAALIGMAVTL